MHGLKRSTHYMPPEDVVRSCVLMQIRSSEAHA
jgi:hypothetical protein